MMYRVEVSNILDEVKKMLPGIHILDSYGSPREVWVEVADEDLASNLELMNNHQENANMYLEARAAAYKATEGRRAWYELSEYYLEALEELRG